MLKVAITGTMCSGKTYIKALLEKLGYKTFSSDECIRDLLSSNSKLREYVKKNHQEVFDNKKQVDRRKLAQKLFDNPVSLKEYEKIAYNEINMKRDIFIEHHKKEKILFFEVPLLFEKNLQGSYDKLLLANAPRDVLLQRIKERRLALGDSVITNMLKSQIPNQYKIKKVDFVIDTSNNEEVILSELLSVVKGI